MNSIRFNIGDIIKSVSFDTSSYYLITGIGDYRYDVLSLKTQLYYVLTFNASTNFQRVSSSITIDNGVL
jgi:hypothetical protein